jgi:hypothetical protein
MNKVPGKKKSPHLEFFSDGKTGIAGSAGAFFPNEQ